MQDRLNLFVETSLKEDLEAYARAHGTSVSAVLREAATEYLTARVPQQEDLAAIFETYEGSPDASTTIDEAVYGRGKRA